VLERLTDENVLDILDRAIKKLVPHELPITPSSSPHELSTVSTTSSTTTHLTLSHSGMTPKIKRSIASLSDGDARTALSLLELVFSSPPTASEESLLASLRRSVSTRYDRTGDSHYDMISALHKSVRGSDGSAALYWLARMLTAGEDPLYIARRLIVMASEDVGLANNHALPLVSLTAA
jgi:putative ATPase